MEWVACPPPGDLSDPGIKPAPLMSLALAGGFFTTSTTLSLNIVSNFFFKFRTCLETMKKLSW